MEKITAESLRGRRPQPNELPQSRAPAALSFQPSTVSCQPTVLRRGSVVIFFVLYSAGSFKYFGAILPIGIPHGLWFSSQISRLASRGLQPDHPAGDGGGEDGA